MKLKRKQVNDLAHPLVEIVRDFYSDKEHRKAFEKWQRIRKSEMTLKTSSV